MKLVESRNELALSRMAPKSGYNCLILAARGGFHFEAVTYTLAGFRTLVVMLQYIVSGVNIMLYSRADLLLR